MITKIVSADKIANQYASEVRLVGLSTDAKPVDVTNATEFEEMDTGDVYIFDAEGAQWLKKRYVGGGLPPVSESDNGKVLTVAGGAWAAQQKKFVVTLTPTAADFSGTMDKTSDEITAAHEEGQEIVFDVVGFPGFDHVNIPAAWYTYATGRTICAACATLVDVTSDLQIIVVTSDVSGSSSYYTDIYTLTPAT